jgi:integrase
VAQVDGAEARAAEIDKDIAYGCFDKTKTKYEGQDQGSKPTPPTVELFDQFIEYKRLAGVKGQTIASKYNSLRANLARFGKDIKSEDDARQMMDFLRAKQSPPTAKQSLSLLKEFGRWVVQERVLLVNPFENLSSPKVPRSISPKRQPLTKEQTRDVLKAFKAHPHYNWYHDFVMGLVYLGCRVSEVVGLRWKDIDWESERVCISESLSRGEDGRSAGSSRQRKETKNAKNRWIDIHPDLLTVLADRKRPGADPDDLIFPGPRGKPIDDHRFSQHAWKAICKQVGIDRVPYALRHSLGSHLLESGASAAQVADVLGNTPETVHRHYAHTINRPQMPGFYE